VKIFFCRAADLLLAGAVMNQEFQPHEAHVPYNLQVEIFSFE
jgi:DNA polymerase zeta